MANQWFRMYSEFATDPKVQMLSESDQRRFLMLLCLRCSNGDVTLQDEEIAFQLRVSNEDWQKTKGILMAKGLIDDCNLPTNWDKRQFSSDSSAARVARHRDKKKKACNVTVTPPDTDTDTDTELKTSLVEIQKPKCEFQKIVDLYNEKLGDNLRSVRDLTDQRKKHIKARINDNPGKRSSPEWWGKYFEFVSGSDFLMGRGPPDSSGKTWQADFDWLINPNNMTKILERKYHAE